MESFFAAAVDAMVAAVGRFSKTTTSTAPPVPNPVGL